MTSPPSASLDLLKETVIDFECLPCVSTCTRPRSRSRDSGDENDNIQERHFRPHFLQAPGDLIVQEGRLCRMDCKVKTRPPYSTCSNTSSHWHRSFKGAGIQPTPSTLPVFDKRKRDGWNNWDVTAEENARIEENMLYDNYFNHSSRVTHFWSAL